MYSYIVHFCLIKIQRLSTKPFSDDAYSMSDAAQLLQPLKKYFTDLWNTFSNNKRIYNNRKTSSQVGTKI
jgi:hypothetical protein